MAFAIMGGLLVATLLTLVFLPTLYIVVFSGARAVPRHAPERRAVAATNEPGT
jgi:hypothetical protein